VANSFLYETMCGQIHELLLAVVYMKLCVDRDLKYGQIYLIFGVHLERFVFG
jgi:hypothetical protein